MSKYLPERDVAYFNGRSPGHLPGMAGSGHRISANGTLILKQRAQIRQRPTPGPDRR